MALNDRQIKNAKPTGKKQTLSDGGGLSLVVTPAGGKWWQFNFRFDGKQKTLRLGVYPDVGLAMARELHTKARELLAAGIDPAQAKQDAKREKRMAAANCFEQVARDWFDKQIPRLTTSHAARVIRSLEVDVFPMMGSYPVKDIKTPLVLETVRAIEQRGAYETASRVLQRIKAVFNYAVQSGITDYNPAYALAAVVTKQTVKHQPALPQSELVEFYRRLLAEPLRYETRTAMLFIMLTFVRAGNIRQAEWCEIDWEKRQWAIPAEKMKMRAAHIVPLSDWALSMLKELKAVTCESRWLFPNYKDHSKPHSENMLSYAMGRMGYSGMATPHGFRSLATDVLNENGFAPDVVERQMAHAERNKVRAAYHRTEYLPQRREMMQWYSDWLKERYDAAVKQLAGDK